MGHWFSTHQENNNHAAATANANNHLEETELSYHAPTLYWTGGVLLAGAVFCALYYYVKKYKKMAVLNMVASIHRSRDHQRDLQLAALGRSSSTIQMPFDNATVSAAPSIIALPAPTQPITMAPSAPPAIQYVAAPQPQMTPTVAPQALAPVQMPAYAPPYSQGKY